MYAALPTEMTAALAGKVALVTGASRGIVTPPMSTYEQQTWNNSGDECKKRNEGFCKTNKGRGIALQLGTAGARVYITGRKPADHSTNDKFPSLIATEAEVRNRGGECIAVYCDHSKPDDIKNLFQQIEKECDGQLDILVNNAFSAANTLFSTGGKKFYELDTGIWDQVNNVGLRNHYICSALAADIMVKTKSGLIVNISSMGSLQHSVTVAYGVGKCALDRMTADMGAELKGSGVTVVSLWPGIVRTETANDPTIDLAKAFKLSPEVMKNCIDNGESVEYPGKAVVGLASDKKIQKKNGRIFMTCDLARCYGFKDIDERTPMDMRSLAVALNFLNFPTLAKFIPSFIRVPKIALHMSTYKF